MQINEGGAAGHLSHPWDNLELSFAELKEMLTNAMTGRLDHATIKLDGQNLVFTWDDGLRAARNVGDIKTGGMTATALAAKFEGRGSVYDAFTEAFDVLAASVAVLPTRVKQRIFADGQRWFSLEIIFPATANVLNYDRKALIFHESPVFEVGEDGSIEKTTNDEASSELTHAIDLMQEVALQKQWTVSGPVVAELIDIANKKPLNQALQTIDGELQRYGLSDVVSLRDYVRERIAKMLPIDQFDAETQDQILDHLSDSPDAISLTIIKKQLPIDKIPMVRAWIQQGPAIITQALEPIEDAVYIIAQAVLETIEAAFIAKPSTELARLNTEVSQALTTIKGHPNKDIAAILDRHIQRLETTTIRAALEGLVFFYHGQAYKFTGAFASVNAVLGMFRYGRAGIKL